MKTLKTIAFALAFAASSFAFAGGSLEGKIQPETIGQRVADLLSSPEIDFNKDQAVVVEFNVNERNEIEVLSVGTEDFFLKRFIKFRLNYEKVDADLVKSKNHFKILVKFSELN